MGYATYTGRIGALAVALGIGAAVANTPGVAWADPDSAASSSSDSSSSDSDSADESPDKPAESDDSTAELGAKSANDPDDEDVSSDSAGGMKVSAQTTITTGGSASGATDGVVGSVVADNPAAGSTAQPSSPTSVAPKKQVLQRVAEPVWKLRERGSDSVRVGADVTNAQSRRGAASSVSETSQVQRSVDAVAASTGQRAAAVTVAQNLTPVSAAQAAFVQKQAVPAVISEPPTPQTTVSGVLTAVGVNPLSDSGPGAPVESPALVALFAGWRRLSEQGLTDETKTVRSQPVLTSQSEDGDGLAFAAETAALMASAAPVTIAAQTGNSPAGVVVSPAPNDPRIYVANTGSNTVSVFNTATGQPIDTNPNVAGTQSISVGSSPSALAISGTRLYVANTGSNTVSVIDTTTYNRIDANPSIFSMDIAVGSSPSALAISGTRLYVANRGGNTVSVIDTATNKVIDVNPSIFSVNIGVGSSPSALAISGTRLYVANRGGNTVSVINTATNSVTNTITVESQPSSVAVSTDGTRVYVANTGTGTVSVINFNATTNTYNLVDTNPNIAGTQSFFVGSAPSSVAVSQDGRLAYAALSSDMVAVIDTSSNVVSLAQIDAAAELGAHALALGPDGRVYVTDGADRVLRSLSLVDGALVTIGRSTLVLPNSNGYAVPASWYFPNHDDAPVGLIYLQHGGYRTGTNMSALAQQLADRTNSIVVTPTVPTNPFDRYDIGNDPIERAVAALFVGDRSALTASAAAAAGHPVTLPQQVVLAGHSYGSNLVAAAAGYIADAGGAGNLKGVILFDPVHDGDGQTGMAKLKGANAVPVMSISAPPCFCSGYGANTTTTINSAPDKFVGIMLVGGAHLDAEGASTDSAGIAGCGPAPTPQNAGAVQTITAAWINDVFTPAAPRTGIYAPAGTTVSVNGATARVLAIKGLNQSATSA